MQTLRIVLGDSSEVLRGMESESIWAVVCDPPYDLTPNNKGSNSETGGNSGGFMGKEWDSTGIAFSMDFWKEVHRVLMPGGTIKAFGGTRTFHKMAKAIEGAGFTEVGMEAWLYSSGFPKSLNISKKIEDESLSKKWEGWGTALKPSWEPIIVARKPE